MKFKYKVLAGFTGMAIFLIATQSALQFVSSYSFVGFQKKDQSTFIGLYSEAKADYLGCEEQLSDMKKARDEANQDILEPLTVE